MRLIDMGGQGGMLRWGILDWSGKGLCGRCSGGEVDGFGDGFVRQESDPTLATIKLSRRWGTRMGLRIEFAD